MRSTPPPTKVVARRGPTTVVELQTDHGLTIDLVGRMATQTELSRLTTVPSPTPVAVYNFRLRDDSVQILRDEPGHYAKAAEHTYAQAQKHRPNALLVFTARRSGRNSSMSVDRLLLNEARAAGAHWFVLTPSSSDTAKTMQRRVNLLEREQRGLPKEMRVRLIPTISMERADVARQLQDLNLMGHSVAFIDFHGWGPKILARLGSIASVLARSRPTLWLGALQVREIVPKLYVPGSLVCNLFGVQAAASWIAGSGGGDSGPIETADRDPWHVPGAGRFVERDALPSPFIPVGGGFDLTNDRQVAGVADVYAVRRTHDLQTGYDEARALREAVVGGTLDAYLKARSDLLTVVTDVQKGVYKPE